MRTSFSITTKTSELGISSAKMLVRPAGSRKNRPTANSSAKTIVPDPGAAADLLLLALLVGRAPARWPRCRARWKPILSDSRERHHAAHHRQPQQAMALGPGDQRLRDDLDLALGALLGVHAAGRELLGASACAPPPPRWTRRASSRPRALPGRPPGRPGWPRAGDPARDRCSKGRRSRLRWYRRPERGLSAGAVGRKRAPACCRPPRTPRSARRDRRPR